MRLTPRDLEILRKLAASRWLTTEQLHALFFVGLSSEMVRRRLRLLRGAGYLQTRQDDRMAPGLHALTADGRRLVTAQGWEGKIKTERQLPKHLSHLMGINTIRVAVELGARTAGWQLGFFFAHWELEGGGWPHKTIPDAACEISAGGQSEMLLFEFDRGTEGARVIRKDKINPYAAGLAGVPFTRVIFVAETAARARKLAEIAREHKRSPRFEFISIHELSPLDLPKFVPSLPVASGVVSAQRVRLS